MASEAAYTYSIRAVKSWIEKEGEEVPAPIMFLIRTLDEDRLIGDIGLDPVRNSHGDTFVGIGIGEREYWGKGYGTDAMQVMLHYVFNELNYRRLGLIVFEHNPRAICSYEKVGFILEGRLRGMMARDGRRWDWFWMGSVVGVGYTFDEILENQMNRLLRTMVAGLLLPGESPSSVPLGPVSVRSLT